MISFRAPQTKARAFVYYYTCNMNVVLILLIIECVMIAILLLPSNVGHPYEDESYRFKLVSGAPSTDILDDDTDQQCIEFCKDKYPYWDKYPLRLKKCVDYCEGKGPDPVASF